MSRPPRINIRTKVNKDNWTVYFKQRLLKFGKLPFARNDPENHLSQN